jgi:eukaryotic-like serine/threonine-protein kinase
VLLIDPDSAASVETVAALEAADIEATAVADAETGLRLLAAKEPDVLLLELALGDAGDAKEKDGRWLLRRLRDDFMGARPRVVLYTDGKAMRGGITNFGADAVVLKPASPAALVAACLPESGDPTAQLERTHELIALSLLHGEMEGALVTLAKRLALTFRVVECIAVAQIGERQWTGIARGAEAEWDDTIWARCQTALDAGVPLLVSGPVVSGPVVSGPVPTAVTTFLGMPLATPGGLQLGFLVLVHEGARLFPLEAVDHLRLLAQRLHSELAWRSVHERIAADRDRLRESSMIDPMLPGVWTRAALEQTMLAEVSACLRRREPMSFVVVDLRGLRHLNERYGHLVGDQALRLVAQIVRQTVRTQDLVARYAGDTLAVVLPGTGLQEARRAVERIQDAIAASPLRHAEEVIPLSVVAGIAPLLGVDDSGEVALGRATAALKAAKRRREPMQVAEGADLGELGVGAATPQPSSQGLEAGTTLGGMYQVLHEISRGAMGVVYRAEDLGLGRPVALKTLRPDLARDQNFVERFRAEASTLAALRHENLVQVYAFGIDGDDVYFVMELVEGEPLDDRIELARHEGKMMPYDEIAHVIAQVGNALDAMHRAGILHRDVKPANILLDRVRSRAVLVDVGIAKRRGTPTDPAGTPGYTAPEVFTGATEGAQADVYGLAATTYTLLTTEVPFRGGNMDEILRRQVRSAPVPASEVRAGIPAAVDAVLAKSLDPDPVRRHASASDFARALAEALRESAGAAAPPPHKRRRPATLPRAVQVPAARPDGSTAVIDEPAEERVITAVRDRRLVVEAAPRDGETGGAGAADRAAGAAVGVGAGVVGTGAGGPSSAPAAELSGVVAAEAPVASLAPLAGLVPPPGPPLHDLGISRNIRLATPTPVIGIPLVPDVVRAVEAEAPPAAMLPSLREPDAPEVATPHTRGVLFRSSYRVLGARHGAAWVAHVSRRHPALAQALQPQNTLLSWHPTEHFVTMLQAIAESGRDARAFASELGRVATAATFSRFFGADPAALSPWHVLSAAEHFWRRYHTWGAVTVERDGELGARVTIAGGPRDALVCASTAGILEQVVTLSGGRLLDVGHPACEAAGAAACVFRVSWQPTRPPS